MRRKKLRIIKRVKIKKTIQNFSRKLKTTKKKKNVQLSAKNYISKLYQNVNLKIILQPHKTEYHSCWFWPSAHPAGFCILLRSRDIITSQLFYFYLSYPLYLLLKLFHAFFFLARKQLNVSYFFFLDTLIKYKLILL